MLSVRLEPEIEQRLTALAKLTGRTMTYYVRETARRSNAWPLAHARGSGNRATSASER